MRNGPDRLKRVFPQPSLRLRLTLILFTTFFTGLAAAVLFFYWEAIGTQSGLRERSLQEQARELLDTIPPQSRHPGGPAPPLQTSPAYAEPGGAYGYTIYGPTGNVQALSPSRASRGPLPLTQIPPRYKKFGPVFFVGATNTAAMTSRTPDGRFFVVVSRENPDSTTLAESLVEQDATPLIVLTPFVLVALALIVLVINNTLRPLQRASSEASKIGPSFSAARVTLRGLPSELTPLVTAFNGALDRLSRAYQIEKRLTADAAHELRTPLAVLRMRLETARLGKGAPLDWGAIGRDFAQIDRLTGQLLDLARKEQSDGAADRKTHVNLARVSREAAALILPLIERTGRTLEVIAPDTVTMASGIEDDLRDMIRNLIENALYHGEGAISVAVESVGDYAGIRVQDEGRGVPEPIRELVFERFRKGDASTPGAGLGLAIVRHVAGKHGGTAEFLEGPKSRVQVILRCREPE